jgi:hypothetical protein
MPGVPRAAPERWRVILDSSASLNTLLKLDTLALAAQSLPRNMKEG